MIEKFITEIRLEQNMNWDYTKSNEFYKYTGDGYGDFEKTSDDTTEKCLLDYIVECNRQIDLAEGALKKMRETGDKRTNR